MTPRVKRLKPQDYADVEKQLGEIFRLAIFHPIIEAAPELFKKRLRDSLSNASRCPLEEAIKSGRIHYEDGVFSGRFSAQISGYLRSIGARYDARTISYRIDPSLVPMWIQTEANLFRMKSAEVHGAIVRALNETQQNLDTILERAAVRFDDTIDMVVADFRDVAKMIGVHPELNEQSKAVLAREYNNNLKLYIKKFATEEILELREDVEANVYAGGRFSNLTGIIQQRYGVTLNKAKFLARQETALFTAKFQEQRFGEAGVTEYIWSTSHDARVRPQAGVTGKARLNDHRKLDGRRFYFSDPPIVDAADGRRANPGEDFNCRCIPIPVLSNRPVTA